MGVPYQPSDYSTGESRPQSGLVPRPSEPARLVGLDPAAFAHSLDRSAMLALRKLRGAEYIVAKFMEWRYERQAHVLHNATSIRVTRKQISRLFTVMSDACIVLDMEEPELYVAPNSGRNAFTSGHNRPFVVLHSELVDVMTDAELSAVIAHELGHIKCNHVLYKEMVSWLELGLHGVECYGSFNRVGAFARLALRHFVPALHDWNQKSELSADRASMLVVRDEDTCIRMMLKLAGAPIRFADELDIGEYLAQASHLQDLTLDSIAANSFRRRISAASSHPITVDRARLLHSWIADGGVAKVLAAPRAPLSPGDLSPGEAPDRADSQ